MPAKKSARGAPKKRATANKAATKKAARPRAPTTPPEGSDWRDETLSRMRRLILEAVPDAVEEQKWKKPSNPEGVPVWSREGILCTGETYKGYVKVTFAKGALLPDPARVFNASLDGNQRRAIDIRPGDAVDEAAFKALVQAAAELNASTGATARKRAK